jgi:hypothetical protein
MCAISDPICHKHIYIGQAEEDIRVYNELVESRIADAHPAERNALAVRMVQEMIAEIDYEIIVDLSNAAYWNTLQQGHLGILDRFVGDWMVKQSEMEEDRTYKYNPKEGF